MALRTSHGIRRAVDGISFSIGQGEILGHRRGERLGQDPDGPVAARPAPARCRGRRGACASRDASCLGLRRRQLREVRGKQVALVSQDPATSLHPLLRIDVQMTEHVRGAPRVLQGKRPASGRSRCWTRCGSPTPRRRSTPTRTSFPAACASASPSPWRWPASRACWWPTSRRRPSTSPCRPGSCAFWTGCGANAACRS